VVAVAAVMQIRLAVVLVVQEVLGLAHHFQLRLELNTLLQ
jgi:hypothetical protein